MTATIPVPAWALVALVLVCLTAGAIAGWKAFAFVASCTETDYGYGEDWIVEEAGVVVEGTPEGRGYLVMGAAAPVAIDRDMGERV